MARHTTCDVCGAELEYGARRIEVSHAGQLRFTDDEKHDVCGICWDYGWKAMVHRVQAITRDLAELASAKIVDRMSMTRDELAQRISTRIAGGRVASSLPNGMMQVTVPVVPNEDGEFLVVCPSCGENVDILTATWDDVGVIIDPATGSATNVQPILSCGHIHHELSIMRGPDGTITSATVVQRSTDQEGY